MTSIRFYLVRHAAAEPKGAAGDAARRLTAEGRRRFAAHARALVQDLAVTRILTSPFARARETADLLAAVTRAPVHEDDAIGSGASTGRALLALAASLGAGTALVGHNPEIGEAIAIAAGRGIEVPAGAVAAIDVTGQGYRLAWLRAPA